MTQEITDANFDTEVLKSSVPVLIDFWAEWCGPCRMLAPIIEELASTYLENKFKIFKLNVDNNPKTSAKYGIMSIPTVIIFKNGQPVERVVGVHAKKDYIELIERTIRNQ